ncbi:MAG: hypothetical protein ACKOWM_06280, partial [Sphingomonadales bacterium]
MVPNIQSSQSLEIQETFLGFIGSDSICWVADIDRTFEVLKREYERAVELHSKHDGPVAYALPQEKYASHLDFEQQLKAHRV